MLYESGFAPRWYVARDDTDESRIGEAEFEVTQPRVTCYRVGMRMGQPELPALLVSHHRPGFYCRVITEGRIRAGDSSVKVKTGPGALSVAETRRAALPAEPGRREAAGRGGHPSTDSWLAGISTPFAGKSVLELAEACDVPTRWSCRSGVCQTCVTPLLSGSISFSPEPLKPAPDGQTLICCAQPTTDLVVDM